MNLFGAMDASGEAMQAERRDWRRLPSAATWV